ncbi:MAG: HSP90 family protein [Lachnospiraceae bacterium]|nr:HSP90 family protein [Lachnospiraceae bacterium]
MASKVEAFHFQVNLGGMLDILSNHLYKSADVFLRELLQNGVDAITLRRQREPGWNKGEIHIRLLSGRKMIFTDNGAGLTKEEIHRFLSVIGQSSKHSLLEGEMPQDYIGRFGIGLLSCFMVSDSIVIRTRSTQSDCIYEWTGLPDGTYTLGEMSGENEGKRRDESPDEDQYMAGTSVYLECKPGCEIYFHADTIERLVQYYGLMLPVPVYLDDGHEPINRVPEDFSKLGQSQLLTYGEWMFGESFLDAIPLRTPHLSGVAYVLPYGTDSVVRDGHRIYLKHMLLTDRGTPLLPEWAFFLRCFLNTVNLRPTASRESFYEDSELELARDEFADAVKAHFRVLSQDKPQILQSIVSVHYNAIKSMAVWDDEIFRLFIDYLPFVTSEGEMTGSALKRYGEAFYVYDTSRFGQLKPVFNAQNRLLICTGYTQDDQLIPKLADMFWLPITPLHEEDMSDVLKEVPMEGRLLASGLIEIFGRSLREFDCRAEMRHFHPIDLPALYFLSDDVRFVRQVQEVREHSSGVFSDALASLLAGAEDKPLATLYLNYYNPLVQRLLHIQKKETLESVAKILYVQALAAGGHSLHRGELKALGKELLYLVECTDKN